MDLGHVTLCLRAVAFSQLPNFHEPEKIRFWTIYLFIGFESPRGCQIGWKGFACAVFFAIVVDFFS